MKRFLPFLLFVFLVSCTSVSAKEYSFKRGNDTITISTTVNTAVITYIHLGTGALQDIVSLWKTKGANGGLTDKVYSEDVNYTPNSPGSKTFTAKNLSPGTIYYFGINGVPVETEQYVVDPNTVVSADKLAFTPDGDTMKINGKIDVSKHPYPEYFDVLLEYSLINSTDVLPQWAGTSLDATAQRGVNHDGTYYWTLRHIEPAAYNFKETFYTKDGKILGTPIVDKFNGKTGYIPPGSAKEQDDFENRSYRLLAPLPGLSVLLDPDLCQEKKIETGKGQICDINDFLNYVFRLLIGISAVVLVIRIMFEGFKYATSDVPALKIDAKSKLWQAIWGLLLALSAWLILNTINPKLVENDIVIPTVTLAYEEEAYQRTIPSDPSVLPKGSIAECTEGVTRIQTAGANIVVCKSIATSIKTMVDTAWAQGIKISGGGFRTAIQQIELRKKNCGVANVYVKDAKCVPPTAFPGNSNHESGLAIDFMCDGITIATRDNKCFVWMQSNASKYGLKNFSKEPWHWSVDGR
jgi:hypothetical protein